MAAPKKTTKIAKTVVSAPISAPVSAPVVERSEIKASGTKTPAAPVAARIITHDMIAKRAYDIFASRGYAAGDQNADWLEAERQLKAGL